jgi:hypothetical protein
MQTLTRKQAIDLCGLDAVNRVDSDGPDFSHREIDDTLAAAKAFYEAKEAEQ